MDVNPDLYSSSLIKLVYECLDQVSGGRALCGSLWRWNTAVISNVIIECYEDNLKGNAGFFNGVECGIANHNQGLDQL